MRVEVDKELLKVTVIGIETYIQPYRYSSRRQPSPLTIGRQIEHRSGLLPLQQALPSLKGAPKMAGGQIPYSFF